MFHFQFEQVHINLITYSIYLF